MKRYRLFALLLVLAASGCAMPESRVDAGTPRPGLTFPDAAPDMVLVLDGLTIGPASQFNGKPGVLVVESGVHQVEIVRDGKTIHRENTAVGGGETRAIVIQPGAH